MASITLSKEATINVVATTSDHSAKSNLGTAQTGSYLTEATMLVYDEILRYQRDVKYTHGLTSTMVNDFDYNQFKGNVLWFMDELVGMESDWIKTASNDETTAYGYVQFTEASVKTAVTRYEYHIKQFNLRRKKRDWEPYEYPYGVKMKTPDWLKTLSESLRATSLKAPIGTAYYPATYNHKENLNALTYDQMLALAFVHLHSKESWDYNFVQLSKGDITAAKTLYSDNHHTAIGTGLGTDIGAAKLLTRQQKEAIYNHIKRIYEPMYGRGSSSTVLDDEPYFNYLKGFVGSYLYKEYDWYNENDDMNALEFGLMNAGNVIYQVMDIIIERETIYEAFRDWWEQAKGVYAGWGDDYDIRDELKGKTVEIQLWNETANGEQMETGQIVYAGFDKNGYLVVWDSDKGTEEERLGLFFDDHYGW